MRRFLVLFCLLFFGTGLGRGAWLLSHPQTYRAAGMFSASPVNPPTSYRIIKGPKIVEIIELDVEIDQEAVDLVHAGLKAAQEAHVDSVLVVIDSPGGEVGAGFKIVKMIENSEIPVDTLVDTRAESMAAFISQSGRVRAITDRSFLMFHQPAISVSTGYGGKADAWKSVQQQLEVVGEGMATYESRRLKISEDEFKKRIENKDYFMNCRDALAVGAVDLIVSDTREKLYAQQVAQFVAGASSSGSKEPLSSLP